MVGIHLGSGCGKTHLLLEAARLLQRPGIHVTCNLNQNLHVDRLNPRETVLLRVLLRLAEVPHAKCQTFLRGPFGKALVSIEVEFLRKFAVRQLSKCCGDKTGVIVGADEIMTLKSDTDPINIVTDAVSELGLVAKKCAKIAKKLCHVFVTSLKEAPLFTASGTAVLHWTPEPPDEKATEIILQPYPVGTRTMEEAKPLLIASAGFHFSSMVFCSSNPWSVFHPVCARGPWQSPRKKERVSDALITDIKNFIVAGCRSGRLLGSQTGFASCPDLWVLRTDDEGSRR